MAALTDAELVLGLSRHLSAYTMGPDRAALGELEFAGWVFDVSFRLRGSTTSPAKRVQAIALDVGLSGRNLRDVMATLETMQWISVARDSDGVPQSVSERLPSPGELVVAAPRLVGCHRSRTNRAGGARVATGDDAAAPGRRRRPARGREHRRRRECASCGTRSGDFHMARTMPRASSAQVVR